MVSSLVQAAAAAPASGVVGMAAAGLVALGGEDGLTVALRRRKLNGPDPVPRFPPLGMMVVLDGFLP